MVVQQTVQDQVIDVSRDYLGPAAERFVNRQISVHLKKKPEKLTKSDVPKLVDWIRLAFSLLTNDRDLVDEYIDKLMSIANNNSTRIYNR
jgi:hypothetical protein